jgi:WD40 repeat protein
MPAGRPHGPPLNNRGAGVVALDFSPDGRELAGASRDGFGMRWDTATGKPADWNLTGHYGAVYAIAYRPDGRRIATGGDDGVTRAWDPAFSSWLTQGCRIVNRNLTQAEWDRFLSGVPYERTCPDLPPGTGAPASADAARY